VNPINNLTFGQTWRRFLSGSVRHCGVGYWLVPGKMNLLRFEVGNSRGFDASGLRAVIAGSHRPPRRVSWLNQIEWNPRKLFAIWETEWTENFNSSWNDDQLARRTDKIDQMSSGSSVLHMTPFLRTRNTMIRLWSYPYLSLRGPGRS
jgi:hypothetical protein